MYIFPYGKREGAHYALESWVVINRVVTLGEILISQKLSLLLLYSFLKTGVF